MKKKIYKLLKKKLFLILPINFVVKIEILIITCSIQRRNNINLIRKIKIRVKN